MRSLFTTDPDFTPPERRPGAGGVPPDAVSACPSSRRRRASSIWWWSAAASPAPARRISAARLGLKVALVQDRPVLGGNNSSEVRVWLQGARNKEPYPRVGDIVAELEQQRRAHYGPDNTADLYEDEKKLAVVRAEKNITLFLEHRVNARRRPTAGAIRGRRRPGASARGRRVRIARPLVRRLHRRRGASGALAGADFEMTPKGHMGPCNLWNVCECKDTNALNTGRSRAAAGAVPALPVGARPDRQAVSRPQQDEARHAASSAAGTGRAASTAIRSPRWSTSATGTSARCTARGTR